MARELDEAIKQRINLRPKWLDNVSGQRQGNKYAKLLDTLKLISAEQEVGYTIDEFNNLYGVHGFAGVKNYFKKNNFKGKIFIDKETSRVHIWKVNV